MKKSELKAMASKVEIKRADIPLNEKIESLREILGVKRLSLNAIIKTMVECNFPTLTAEETIGHYVQWFYDWVISNLIHIKDGIFTQHYKEQKHLIETLIKNANRL